MAPKRKLKRKFIDSVGDISQSLFSEDVVSEPHFNDTDYTELGKVHNCYGRK